MLKFMNGLLHRVGTGIQNCVISIEMNVTSINSVSLIYKVNNNVKPSTLRNTFLNLKKFRINPLCQADLSSVAKIILKP